MKNFDKASLASEYNSYHEAIKGVKDMDQIKYFGNFVSSLMALIMIKVVSEVNISIDECNDGIDSLSADAKGLVSDTLNRNKIMN